jgi:D-glycero-D-manno-heptose 1,7-bisphosphate phosphatase
MNKAIFMDRDGVINKWEHGDKDVPESWYVLKWEDFEFLPGVMDAFKLIAASDYLAIIVSNQSGIERGFATYDEIDGIFDFMSSEIYDGAGIMPEYYFCPHSPDAGCACRKPSPGMLYKAAIEHDIDLSKSWMVGDSDTDIWAAKAAGITKLIKVIDCGRYKELKEMSEIERGFATYDEIDGIFDFMSSGATVALGAPEMYCYFVPRLFRAVEFILELDGGCCSI